MAADCKSAAPRSYGGSNPPLCTTCFENGLGSGLVRVEGVRRVAVALAVLLSTGALAWATMDAGRIRDGVLVLLAGFALRIVLLGRREP